MVVVSYSGKEINAKLVYYGAGLSGKTTNLEAIYEAVPETSRGKMVSMKTQSDRTLFFDLLPLDLGEIMGFKTRFLLYTVPGQVFYNATRKLVLKGADAIVFVADSQVGKMDENKESLGNLNVNLNEYGLRLEDIPWVLQYNKRDLPNAYSIDELNAELNPGGAVPTFEAIAMQGVGVFETFRGISHLLMQKVTRELHRGSSRGTAPSARSAPKSPTAPAPAETSTSSVASPPAPVAPDGVLAGAREGGVEPTFTPPAGFERPRDHAAPPSPRAALAVERDESVVFDDRDVTFEAPPRASADSDRVTAPSPNAPLELDRAPTIGIRSTRSATPQDGPPSRVGFEERTLSLTSPAAAPTTANASVATAPDANGSVVVPITITPGSTREIVLRIVIKADDRGN